MAPVNIPQFLEEAFNENFSHTDQKQTFDFYVAALGTLKVVTGKITACDPMLHKESTPFTATFPTGSFPVQLAVAKVNDDERVGFARLNFSDKIPVSWVMAVYDENDLKTLRSNEIIGYGVDSGTGAFMDSTGAKELGDFLAESEDNFEQISNAFYETFKPTWCSLIWEKNETNVALFSSGWGDGFYASYIGYDEDSNICRLVTDFSVI